MNTHRTRKAGHRTGQDCREILLPNRRKRFAGTAENLTESYKNIGHGTLLHSPVFFFLCLDSVYVRLDELCYDSLYVIIFDRRK